MKIQESGEMYLEYILLLQQSMENVRAIDIVNMSGYSKPSISRALGLLKNKDLITVDKNGHITLTESGESKAKKIYERHQILHEFLMKIGVSEETADKDACKIEHIVSDETIEAIKKQLY
ncbi:MAG: metal-dependent transcriptional regulator [Ruminococcaceae bacterium]|nr:metal-dependent transcriptional regulator [Oscillospiraceae bacterium]